MPEQETLTLDETIQRIKLHLAGVDWEPRRFPEPMPMQRHEDPECPDYECPSSQQE